MLPTLLLPYQRQGQDDNPTINKPRRSAKLLFEVSSKFESKVQIFFLKKFTAQKIESNQADNM